MNKIYVEYRDKGYWIANSRVSLDTIVYAFLDSQSPESIAQSLPVLTLETRDKRLLRSLSNMLRLNSQLLS